MLARRDEELTQAFRALSADALAANNEQFVRLAEGRIKEAAAALSGDAALRDKAIGALLDPMSAALQRVEGQLRDVEKERQSAYIGLREQVSAMRTSSEQLQYETKSLVNALRAPQWRQRPRSTTHESTGTFSIAPSSLSQLGQWEPGRTIDSWRGTRHTTTLRNEPTARPRTAVSTQRAITGPSYRTETVIPRTRARVSSR